MESQSSSSKHAFGQCSYLDESSSSRIKATTITNTNRSQNNNNCSHLTYLKKSIIMEAICNLIEINKNNLTFKYNFVDELASNLITNTNDNSVYYKLPCNLIDELLVSTGEDSIENTVETYELVRKLIDLNKAYYLSLCDQLPKRKCDVPSPTSSSSSSYFVELIEDLAHENAQNKFSETLTNQLFDESFCQLVNYDKYAVHLVDNLIDDLKTSNFLDESMLHPLSINVQETLENNRDQDQDPDQFDQNSSISLNSTSYSSDFQHYNNRRHSACLEQEANYRDTDDDSNSAILRRHSFNTVTNHVKKFNFHHPNHHYKSTARVIRPQRQQSACVKPATRENKSKMIIFDKKYKRPIINITSEAESDSQMCDTLSLSGGRIHFSKSNPDLDCAMQFKQYRKVTLKNLLNKSPNNLRKEYSANAALIGNSAFVKQLVEEICQGAFVKTEALLKSHSKFATNLEKNIFDDVFDNLKTIDLLNKKLKHVCFHCDCYAPNDDSTITKCTKLSCKITVFSMMIALNEFKFSNHVTFKCNHI